MEQAFSKDNYEPDLEPSNDEAAEKTSPLHSLSDDATALFEDGKTYLQAELAYQRSRGSFVANRVKSLAIFAIGALALLHLALIALVVGLVIALIPVVGPWAATGIVVTVLLVGAAILALLLKSRANDIRQAFSEGSS